VSKRIESIEAILLYGHFYLKHRFTPGVNIVYGHNGSGKTTLLNILTNILGGDFRRFAYIEFANINIEFDDGVFLEISRNRPPDREEYIDVKLDDNVIWTDTISHAIFSPEESTKVETDLPSATYLPAYRNLYDYLSLSQEEQSEKLLSPFAPPVYFPSMREIEESLESLETLVEIPENIKLFVDIVNKFYENKKLIIKPSTSQNPFELRYDDKYITKSFSSLSSGERQITTIFYAISQLKPQGIVLIDEPEISLHLDWQRKILRSISQIFETEQIIACTHSPAIGGDYEINELEFRFVGK